MIGMWTESTGAALSILTPLMAVPLTAITFYLRSLREQQTSMHQGVQHRVESVEQSIAEIRRRSADFERDYTTKEEWLRECMLARQTLQRLSETTVRIETRLQTAVSRAGASCGPMVTTTRLSPGSHTDVATVGRAEESYE